MLYNYLSLKINGGGGKSMISIFSSSVIENFLQIMDSRTRMGHYSLSCRRFSGVYFRVWRGLPCAGFIPTNWLTNWSKMKPIIPEFFLQYEHAATGAR